MRYLTLLLFLASTVFGAGLVMDPEGIGTINGDNAGETITSENDRDGEACYIVSTAADTWYAMFLGSSTVWAEE